MSFTKSTSFKIPNIASSFYIGLSENIHFRLTQHNSGESRWTKEKGPWKLVWSSDMMTLSEARKLENLLKRQKGGSGFYRITGLTRSSGS